MRQSIYAMEFTGNNYLELSNVFGQDRVVPCLLHHPEQTEVDYITVDGRQVLRGNVIVQIDGNLIVVTSNMFKDLFEPTQDFPTCSEIPSIGENLQEIYSSLKSYSNLTEGEVEFNKAGEITRLIAKFNKQ